MHLRSLSLLLTAVTITALTGCAGLSFQSYGPTHRGHSITQGAARADVLASMGEPDAIYRSTDTEAFFYHNYKGASYFGIVNTIKRMDTIIVMDSKGSVLSVAPVEVGAGTTLFSSPLFGATYPVPATELTEGPDNYSYEASKD